MLEERDHPVRDGVARRLVAGDGEQHEEHVELHLRQLLAVDLRIDDRGHDVAGRRDPLLLTELVGVGEHLDRDVHRFVGRHEVLGVGAADHLVGPIEQLAAVFLRHAEDLRDRLERQLGRDVGHEVALAAFDHTVDDLAAAAPDLLLEQLDDARCERGRHNLAVPRVLRRVHHQHHRADAGLGPDVGQHDPAGLRLR